MILIRATLLLLGFLAADRAFAASFDCAKATSDVEKTICASPALSALDSQLQDTYRKASATVAASNSKTLLNEQRNWVRLTRNTCADEACLTRVYQARIDVLAHTGKYIANPASCDIPDGKSCRSVVTYRDASVRIDSFNQSLAATRKGAKIVGCYKLVDLPVGTANGNHSFGGYCRMDEGGARTDVMICNDDMFGHFAVDRAEAKDAGDKALVDYVNTRCFGG